MKIPNQLLRLESAQAWRAWLAAHHANQKEAWLVIKKNQVAMPGVFYEEAVEEAVCFGWIDGFMKSLNAETYVLRFTPRKLGSLWSVSNIQRVERLLQQGRMAEAGIAAVQKAQTNGEWEASLHREDITNLPEDLIAALSQNEQAKANFDQFPASQKKQFLYWINSARTTPTRQKRIRETVQRAEKNQRIG